MVPRSILVETGLAQGAGARYNCRALDIGGRKRVKHDSTARQGMALAEAPRAATLFSGTAIVLLAAGLRLGGLDHLPPGLFYDESANGVDALGILAGAHPVFFSGNQGREPLYIYLQALSLLILGPSPLALRLPSAFLGILSVALLYSTGRAFFGARAGAVASLLLAGSFWHLSLSRLAFSAVGMPVFLTAALYWFGKGIQTARLRDFAIAGLCLGVDLYTYLPSRLTPALFLVWILGCLALPAWRRRLPPGSVLKGAAIFATLAVITVLPLAVHFAHHPRDFLGRIQAEQPRAGDPPALAGFPVAVGALLVRGDPNPRHNLPERPQLELPIAGGMIVGALVALRRWADGRSLVMLIGSIMMLAPGALSREPAHALRLVGEIPFTFALAAVGFEQIRGWLDAAGRSLGTALVIVVLALTTAASLRDYFVVWASRPDVYDAFQTDALRQARLLPLIPPDAVAFATAEIYEGQPIPARFEPPLLARTRPFNGRNTLVVPATPDPPVYYLYSRTALPSNRSWLDRLEVVARVRDPFDRTEAELFRLAGPRPAPIPPWPADARLGSAIRIDGYAVDRTVRPGQSLHLSLYWTVIGQLPAGDWAFFAHLVGHTPPRLLGEDYNDGFPPSAWRAGDRVISSFAIPVAPDAAAEVTEVDVGLFNRVTGQRLAATNPRGEPAGTALVIRPVRIDHPTPEVPPSQPLLARFGTAITLEGYDLSRSTDGTIVLRLHWRAQQPVADDYTVFVHLLGPDGQIIGDADSQPGQGSFPTSTWVPGEAILDTHVLHSPPRALSPSRIELGLYRLSTGARLPLHRADGATAGDSLTILL